MGPRGCWSIAPASASPSASPAATAPHPLADFEKVIRVNLIGTFNMIRLAAAAMAQARTDRGRARGDHFDGLDRGLRRADRAGRLFRLQGRRGGDDAADRARARAVRHPGQRDRARRLHDADDGRPAAGRRRTRSALRCRSPPASASRPNMPRSQSTLSRTAISTARRSGSTARCAWRPNRRTARRAWRKNATLRRVSCKEIQGKPSKKACISLHFLGPFWAFQGLTANKNKKIPRDPVCV